MYRIGVDIGGTFTDLVAVDQSGAVHIAKYPTTPQDQSIGLVEGLSALAEEIGMSRDELLAQTPLIIHGTTTATNALLERKGAKVGMLVTEGFRDIVTMQEGLKPDRYNLRLAPDLPLVPRRLCLPIVERTRYDGASEITLDEDSVVKAIEVLKTEAVEAVAVCCLHSYADGNNEKRVRELAEKHMPSAYVSLSSEVLPQIKEYERFSTTVVNAFVGPVLSNYLQRLQTRLSDVGYAGDFLIMHSHGGLATIEDSLRLGVGCVLSGPAGGIAGAQYAAELTGTPDLITFDMGGTSTDIALLDNGEPYYSSDRSVDGARVALPSIDIHTLGAGGGSIARVEIGGMLKVGPESAGSDPGPACYSRGGDMAATTDANVVLGYYDGDNFLGGRIEYDEQAAQRALDAVAEPLGVTREEAAEGVLRVINTQMAEGVRIVATRAGTDPRNYALLSFGGAAGLHITDVARVLEAKRVLIPKTAAVLSAWGMLATNLRYDFVRTAVGEIGSIGAEKLRGLFHEMELEGDKRLADVERLINGSEQRRSLDMRYGEQIFEINVSIDGLDLSSPAVIDEIVERFHQRHEDLYTYRATDQEVVLVNVRSSSVGLLDALPSEPSLQRGQAPTALTHRRVYLDGWCEIPVYHMDLLAPGPELAGPAIVESKTTTILLKHGDVASITETGWLDIDVSAASSERRDERSPQAGVG